MSLPLFLGNHKAERYRDMVADLVQSYKANVNGFKTLKILKASWLLLDT
jgi:hypothetical protein